jgi:hypothetical protein
VRAGRAAPGRSHVEIDGEADRFHGSVACPVASTMPAASRSSPLPMARISLVAAAIVSRLAHQGSAHRPLWGRTFRAALQAALSAASVRRRCTARMSACGQGSDPEAIAFQDAVVEVPLAQGVASRTVLGKRQRLHRVPLAAAAGVSALPGRLEGVLIAVEIRIGKQVREVEEAVRCGLLVVLSFERLVGEPAQRRFARRTGGSR